MRNVVRWPFNRLFEDLFGISDDRALPELWTEERFIPAINVSEGENALTLTAEVPGIAREDLNVTVEDGVLVLRGEKKEDEGRQCQVASDLVPLALSCRG